MYNNVSSTNLRASAFGVHVAELPDFCARFIAEIVALDPPGLRGFSFDVEHATAHLNGTEYGKALEANLFGERDRFILARAKFPSLVIASTTSHTYESLAGFGKSANNGVG